MRANDPVTAGLQEAAQIEPVVVLTTSIERMLSNMPTAHGAPPIGRRIVGHGCHGETQGQLASSSRACATSARTRIRFVYVPAQDSTDHQAPYHQHLVNAEMLLDRVLAARAAGLRPMAPTLDYAAEARATVQPPRGLFHTSTLEHRRWHDDKGKVREQPLTQEALAAELSAEGLSIDQARDRACHRSHALPGADQAWLIDRRNTPLACRPLNQAEFRSLVAAVEGAYQTPALARHVMQANRRIAMQVAELLGSLLDEYVASPFSVAALSDAFSARHLSHLRQTIVASRQAESDSRVLAGPRAWFVAKAARMRAEHQLGLANSPAVSQSMRLTGRPVVTMVGGKLRTFVDGWSRGRLGSSIAGAVPKSVKMA